MSDPTPAFVPDDRSLFSLHPEDEELESLFHSRQLNYLVSALTVLFPACFVARNMAVYWVPGQREHPYVGPDLFVSRHPPTEEDPWVYLTYEDGPIAFVVEVASEKSRAIEATKRDETYGACLGIPEDLYVDRERDRLELWRLTDGVYQQVSLDDQSRLWSQELNVGFVWQEDRRLVRVLTADGVPVPTDQEVRALRQSPESQAREGVRGADQAACHANQEALKRQEAVKRVASLAAEVERLRRALEEGRGDRE